MFKKCIFEKIYNVKKEIEGLKKKYFQERKENKSLFAKLKKMKGAPLDQKFHALHNKVFKEIDCLECANCCKTSSPIFIEKDVSRISKHLNMKPGDFHEKYLKRDDEYDIVLKESPCAFLNENNSCSIYDVRPRACSEYPHTNRKKMSHILPLTLKNIEICPAVSRIVSKMKAN